MLTTREIRRPLLWILLLTLGTLVGVASGQTAAVIAEVNGAPITRQSFQIDYRRAVNEHARKGNPVNEAYLRDLRIRLIDYLVETELLRQDAKAQGIQVSAQDLDQAVAADRAQFKDDDQFRGYLQAMGLSFAEYRERRQRDLVIEKLIATHIARDVVISDQDIKDHYREHAARYRVPARLHIRHITLRFPPDADETQKSAVGDRMRDIQRQIAAGRDFAEMASRYSEDPSRQKGGDAGFVDADLASRTFGKRVLEIPTGQVSAPLETPRGYHLVTIEARRPSREIPLSEVREGIRQTLLRQKTSAPVKAYVKALRQKAKIIVHE